MWRFIASLSAVRVETLSEQRRKSELCRTCFMTLPKCIIDLTETRTILRTAQIVPKLKNNEPRPKLTGSYKKSVYIEEPIKNISD